MKVRRTVKGLVTTRKRLCHVRVRTHLRELPVDSMEGEPQQSGLTARSNGSI